MVDILATPFLWVVATIALYAVAYWGYGKWIDRNVWRSDAKKATPAHMYMDGVEYFPVSRYVLWGYQFKSVAALGPILGPFIGITFGWLPALLWIIGGNFFIGWLQDYGSMMLSVRKEGRSFGPITYEFTGARGCTNLLAFVLFYLIIISAAFIALIASFWNQFSGSFVATVGILLAGLLCGQLLYRMKMNVFAVTGIGLALVVLSIYMGVRFPITLPWGVWNVPIWGLICAVILYAAAVLPTPMFVQPTSYLAFYPAYAAIILLLVGALATPFLGSLTGPVLTTFFGLVLIIYALTVQALVTRFFRLVAGETWGEGRFRVLGNKHVSSVVGLAIPWGFAVSGSWWALWLYFGGANQLLAGLAIMLITIHLAKVRARSRYSLIPGVFMVVTTLAALVWQTGTFLYSVWAYLQNDKTWVLRNVRGPIQTDPNSLILAVAINAVFVIIGAALFVVGVSMAIRLFRSYNRSVAEARAKAPAAADGGTAEKGSP